MRQYVSFTGLHAGTVELSLGLHASRQLSDKVLRSHLLLSRPLPRVHIEGTGGSRFLAASPCRHGGRTVSSPPRCGVRRTVSEGSDLLRDRPSLRIVRTVRLLPRSRYARILGVSRIWPIFIKARVWNLKHSVTWGPPIREAGRDFSRPPHVAMRIGLYHRHGNDVRRTVSEGSDLLRGRPSLRIVRTPRLLPSEVLGDPRMSPHMAEFCDPLRRGS